MKAELFALLRKVLEMRYADPTQWTSHQALLEDLKETTTLEEKAKAYRGHTFVEAVRLEQLIDRLSKELEV